MGEIGAHGIRFDDRPFPSGLLEGVGQLHHAWTILHVEFNLGLRVIALNCDLLHDRVKGLQVQIAFVGQMRLDGDANIIFRAGGALFASGQKNHKGESN